MEQHKEPCCESCKNDLPCENEKNHSHLPHKNMVDYLNDDILNSEYYKEGGNINNVDSVQILDAEGLPKIDLKSIEKLTENLLKLPQTKAMFVDENGDYLPSRLALHKKIIDEVKKNITCIEKTNPIAILMGGSPASGKSTFVKKYRPYLMDNSIYKIDADDIRAKLPEYKGFNATQTHLETKDIVNTLLSDRAVGVPCEFDLIYDGTMNSIKSYEPLINLLKDKGYTVFIVYIDNVPYETVVTRNLNRYRKSGRFVPIEVIDDFYEKGTAAFEKLKGEVDGYVVVDGSSHDYNIIEQGGMEIPNIREYDKIGYKLDKSVSEKDMGGKFENGGKVHSYENQKIGKGFEFEAVQELRKALPLCKIEQTKKHEISIYHNDKLIGTIDTGMNDSGFWRKYDDNIYLEGFSVNTLKEVVDTINESDGMEQKTDTLGFKKGGAVAQTEASDIEDGIEQMEGVSTQNLWIGDAYYKLNPEKILGEPYEASGKFGKVTKYKPIVSANESISRIEADTDFMKAEKALNDPLASTMQGNANPFEPISQSNIDRALEESDKEVMQKLKRKVKKQPDVSGEPEKGEVDLQSFEDIYNLYNPEISDEELFAFIWYKDSIGERLSQRWYDLALSRGATNESLYAESTIKKWVEQGVLFYYSGVDERKGKKNLIPAYLFLSGNMYDRVANLKRDEEDIVELYGAEVYAMQTERLDLAWKEIYSNRLLVDSGGASDRLVILPVSDFAKDFKIKTLQDELEFKGKADKDGKPKLTDPNFTTKAQYGRQVATEFESLSLKDAFSYWLLHNKNKVQLKKDTTVEEIVAYYIEGKTYVNRDLDKAEAAQMRERIKARTKLEGDRLFPVFLAGELTLNDKVRLETEWNRKFNGVKQVDYNKIPVAFDCAKEFRNESLDVRPEKREAAAFTFNEGAGCLAYGTGIGKTFSSIFSVAQAMDAGYSQRPVFVVPNQVYKQFLNEIKGLLPHRAVLELYNLSNEYADKVRDNDGELIKVKSGTITIMTYEGFERLGFNAKTENDIISDLYTILNQGDDTRKSARSEASFEQRLATIMGRGLSGTMFSIEELGFDYFTFDEAHKGKKVFTSVKGSTKEDGEGREKNSYQISSGTPSTIALKMFMISQYVLRNYKDRNIVLLTATPFTNSPLEIFSMLSMISYGRLKALGLENLTEFFDTFIDVSYDLVINAQLKPVRKQVVLGFNNLVAMQSLIERFINYKGEDQVVSNKPNKWVLPMTKKVVDGTVVMLSPDERVENYLSMSPLQAAMMDDIKLYVQGNLALDVLCSTKHDVEDDDESVDTTEDFELDEKFMDEDEKAGVKILRGMNYARNLALSPYLYECSGMKNPNYKQYIETSPKLSYVMGCIKSVKKYHEDRGELVSGQVIYMDRGVDYFELIKEYLIKELGYTNKEVGIIRSGLPKEGARSKSEVQNRFLGQRWNPETFEMEDIPDEDRIKVVIGSGTIREGINLQRYSTVLYNCFVDWNPTDQIQLDGRIHRQGNIFSNVRINIPLMMDSMDIFIFQKLEEKTSRLNTIWAKNGRQNILKLEDFDPKELKYVLIKDPKVLAELQIKEDVELLEDEIAGKKQELQRISEVKTAIYNLKYYRPQIIRYFEDYIELKESDSDLDIVKKAIAALRKTTDKDGKPFITNEIRAKNNWPYWSTPEEAFEKYSRASPITKPYWFDTPATAYRYLSRELRDYFAPRNLDISMVDPHVDFLKNEIERMESQKKESTNENAINLLADEIMRDREAKQIREKTTLEVISDFEKLNYLLSIKKVATAQTAKAVKQISEEKATQASTAKVENQKEQEQLALAMELELALLELELEMEMEDDVNASNQKASESPRKGLKKTVNSRKASMA